MGRGILILLLCGAAWGSTVQEKKLDSLYRLLDGNKPGDTTYIDLLNEIAWYQCYNNATEGLKIAEKAIGFSKELQNDDRLAKAYGRKAINLKTLGKDSLALDYYNRAITIYKAKGDSLALARTVFNKGIVYFNRSDYLQSTAHYQRALSIFETVKDSLLIARIYNSIGINQMTLANYPNALNNYLQAARIYERAGGTSSLDYANILNNLGLVQAHLGDLSEALDYQQRALDYFSKFGENENTANVLTNLGNIYKDTDQPDKALDHYEKALGIMRKVGSKMGVANALCNIGLTYISKREYERGIIYLDSTQPMYEETGNINNLAQLHQGLGKAYTKLHFENKEKGFLTLAQDHFEKAVSMASTARVLDVAQESWENLAETFSLLGKYEQAFKADEMAMLLNDSLDILSQKEETARLEAAYAYEQREDRLRALQKTRDSKAMMEIERQKDLLKTVVLGIIFGAALLFSIWFFNKRKQRERVEKELAAHNLQIAKTQLKALQAQLNPHFMFNSMNTVSAFILNKNPGEALDFLARIGGLIRKTLNNSEELFILLQEEVEFMNNYMSLEIMRASGTITYNITVAEDVDVENTLIPPGILQPFIENSIWHAPGKGAKAIHIGVFVERRAEHLFCAVEDNGVGRTVNGNNLSGKAKHQSMGFKIAKSRIEIINRMHHINASLVVIDKDEGLRIEMKLPYLEAY